MSEKRSSSFQIQVAFKCSRGNKSAVLWKGGFGECTFTPIVGVKIHPPRALPFFKGKIACGKMYL